MDQKVTIKDVAELAGVSKSTVSRYLNQGYISLEKQERVRAAIEKTGFQSNFFAKRLKTKESNSPIVLRETSEKPSAANAPRTSG